jgi:excinuclease ABC subunit A
MTTQKQLVVRGAREHNLKNIHVSLPRNRLIVVTGLSGSGKSSLAFDTIYAEGQRRYVESLSTYARQFLGQMEKPDVDRIEGLSPAISIEQKTTGRNPRSTVGTMTEIYDYLRLFFARVGAPHCHTCGRLIVRQSVSSIAEQVGRLPEGTRVTILSPVVRGRKGEHRKVFEIIAKEGFVRVRVDGTVHDVDTAPKLHKQKKHSIEIVVDRVAISPKNLRRITESLETAARLSQGVVLVEAPGQDDMLFSERFSCPHCGSGFDELSPRLFSFNSPYGACRDCGGLGAKMEFSLDLIAPNQALSIMEGALAPIGKPRGEWGRSELEALGERYGFALDAPFSEIGHRAVNAILYGSEGEITVKLDFAKAQGEYQSTYEGLIPWLKRRYRQTGSDAIRKWIESYMRNETCSVCGGARLRQEALAVRIGGLNIAELCARSVKRSLEFFNGLELKGNDRIIADPILHEIVPRLRFLDEVGLGYLALDRSATTLAGGEAQRLRLATQIGSKLMGVLYILDEPSIGLHHRDNGRLIHTLKELRDLGNTVVVIEHDRETILAADYVVDLGPAAGLGGGYVVAEGTVGDIKRCEKSLTGSYLRRDDGLPPRDRVRSGTGKSLVVHGARANNLKNIDVSIPLGVFTCVTGVSGSGKSSLVNDILFRALRRHFYGSHEPPGEHSMISGIEHIDKVVDIDQSPIGRTPRSNPATYTGMFTPIRDLFAQLPESRVRGYGAGRFSFNVSGGRCERCQGDGLIKVEMHFLPDVYVKCETCKGKRFSRETLEVTYKHHNITDVLNMTVDEANDVFVNIPAIRGKCEVLKSVGLGYIHLGQSAVSLSGGEAQRVKLATQLSKRGTGKTMYLLDEPTTGLHHYDVRMLIDVLNKLVNKGNSVVVIEHNPDVILAADHVIDLGPEGGDEGGEMVAAGAPHDIMACERSYTGQMLKAIDEGA